MSYQKQVEKILTERGFDLQQYRLREVVDQEAEFKGKVFIYELIKNPDFTIEVQIDTYKGKIGYYTIQI